MRGPRHGLTKALLFRKEASYTTDVGLINMTYKVYKVPAMSLAQTDCGGQTTLRELSEKLHLSPLSGLPLRLYVNRFNKLVAELVISKNVGGPRSPNARGGVAAVFNPRSVRMNNRHYCVIRLWIRYACLH